MKIKYKNLTAVLTSTFCPEQYDVFDENNNQVGYLRLRHGYFTCTYPNVNGIEIYSTVPLGDGQFESWIERKEILINAFEHILLQLNVRKNEEFIIIDNEYEELESECTTN